MVGQNFFLWVALSFIGVFLYELIGWQLPFAGLATRMNLAYNNNANENTPNAEPLLESTEIPMNTANIAGRSGC